MRHAEYKIPVVCVGNLTVGGTGKTPVSEFLIANFKEQYNIAFLSRGYGRRTKGYREVSLSDSYLDVGDEPKQIKLKFPDIVVTVCEKRREGIERIMAEYPDVNLIILDDGFQHRYVEAWVNIILMDYTRPIYRDHPLPWGTLRDNISQLYRAHYVVVTKCPPDMNALDRRLVYKSLGLYPYQKLYFTSTEMRGLAAVFPEGSGRLVRSGCDVMAMSGIGNPQSFADTLETKYNVVMRLDFPDHHIYRVKDLKEIEGALDECPADTIIITTEKDAVKLMGSSKIPQRVKERLYYTPIKITFNESSGWEFLSKLRDDVRTNPKHSFLHPRKG
jgi:tetraacyldisaccharide 4'-kinase